MEPEFNHFTCEGAQQAENFTKCTNSVLELAKSNFSGVDFTNFQMRIDSSQAIQDIANLSQNFQERVEQEPSTQEKRFLEALIKENNLLSVGKRVNEGILEEGKELSSSMNMNAFHRIRTGNY